MRRAVTSSRTSSTRRPAPSSGSSSANNLPGDIVAAHIHLAPFGVAGPVVQPLPPTPGAENGVIGAGSFTNPALMGGDQCESAELLRQRPHDTSARLASFAVSSTSTARATTRLRSCSSESAGAGAIPPQRLLDFEMGTLALEWSCAAASRACSFVRRRRRAPGALGLTGWVRNRPDGAVEAVFEGPQEPVESMLRWCEHGRRARVWMPSR